MILRSIIISAFMLTVSFNAFSSANPSLNGKINSNVYDAFGVTSATFKSTSVPTQESVRVIIRLKKPASIASLKPSENISNYMQMIKEMQDNFKISLKQTGLYSTLGGTNINGFSSIMNLKLQNAIAGYVPSLKIVEMIAERSDVETIEIDKLNKLFTVEGRELVGSDVVAASGYTGNDVGIAIIDSSFDLLHPELGGSIQLPNGVVFAGENFSDPGLSVHSQEFSECYHGTGTASIARRYAPDSGIYALTVFPNAYDSTIANAINWVVENKDGVDGGPAIKIISMSLGGGQHYSTCDSGVIHDASGLARENGIIVFAASGNDGYTSSIANPACSSNVISIGSVWDQDDTNYQPFSPANCSDNTRLVDERTCYSNKSPVLDLYAPSEEVICAKCGGGTWSLGGTSSATPAAAGITAQLLQMRPDLAQDKDLLVSIYQDSGVEVIGDETKRRIDLLAAIGDIVTHPPTIDSISIATAEKEANVTVSASDIDSDLRDIVLYVDGQEYSTTDVSDQDGQNAQAELTIKYITLDAGEHCVKAFAIDNASNQSEWSDEACFISPDMPRNPPTIDSINVSANELGFTVTGSASDPDDDLTLIELELNSDGNWFSVSGLEQFTYSAQMEEGSYSIRARATDEGGLISTPSLSQDFELVFSCMQYTANNGDHKSAGRAYSETTGWWWTTTTWYATGSDENLGTSSSDVVTLSERPKGHFSVGSCPVTDPVAPVITDYELSVNGNNVIISGTATDVNGDLDRVIAEETSTNISMTCSGTEQFNCTFSDLEPGTYSFTILATDKAGLASLQVGPLEATVDDIPPPETCITATNYDHVATGRAYEDVVWYTSYSYATGSGDSLGLTGSVWYSTSTSLKEENPNYWIEVNSCP